MAATGASTKRSGAVRILVVLACVATVLALVVGYVERAAVDSGQFANRATEVLRDPSVRGLIADRITDDVVLANRSELLAARPLIRSAVASIVGGPAFLGLFRGAVDDFHRALVHGDQDTFTLTARDMGAVIAGVVQAFQPSLAARLDRVSQVKLLTADIGSVGEEAVRIASTIRVLAAVLLAIALASTAGALALSSDRRRTVAQLGVGLAAGGIVLAVGLQVARSIALGSVSGADARSAAGAVWDAFLADLGTAALILAGAGAVVAACARSLIGPMPLADLAGRAGRVLSAQPESPVWRLVRAVALVFAGVLFLADPGAVVELGVTLAGVCLIAAGVNAILRVVHRPAVAGGASASRARLRPRSTRVVAPVLAVALIGAAAAIFLASGGAAVAGPPPEACEGHAALCDRALTEIALPTTHNAMSAPLPGWYSAEQDRPIADQLSDGIRGLMIDTHYADRLANGRLRTAGGDSAKLVSEARKAGVSSSAIQAGLRLRERLGFAGKGTRGVYLCHGLCELGGTPLFSVLRQLHDFLVANPNQVVVVINEDYVRPADFVAAVDAAGLGRLAYSPPAKPMSGRWPTLREMIERDQRVVFLAENQAGAAPWYQPAYTSILEETPYQFSNVSQLTDSSQLAASCRANRGPAGAPLLLLNNWVSTTPAPLPANAEKVNAFTPLLRRARECERQRHHVPNLVAVNFYRRGNVFKVVDAPNGVDDPPQ